MNNSRIVVTGMSVITPIGDTLDSFYANLLQGKSAVTKWKTFKTENIYGKIGGDLYGYDLEGKFATLDERFPETLCKKARRLKKSAPWGTQFTVLIALEAFKNAYMESWVYDPFNVSVVVAGHNLNRNYSFNNQVTFMEEPEFIEGMYGLRGLDSDHAGTVTELLGFKGPTYTVGGACASGNIALKQAIDEMRYHGMDAAMVMAPLLDISPLEVHSLTFLEAISYKSFNENPDKASRPYDIRREGFVPAHGAAALVIETLDKALARGATIHAEICGVEASADANHLPEPSREGQAYLIKKLLKNSKIAVEEIDYINAHATSTPRGDLCEVNAIKDALGKHAYKIKINAPKSMLGHTCWSAATVETVGAIMQMKNGTLHPSINIDEQDPEIDLDVCANQAIDYDVNIFMKNSFGFGGLNSISLFKRYEE